MSERADSTNHRLARWWVIPSAAALVVVAVGLIGIQARESSRSSIEDPEIVASDSVVETTTTGSGSGSGPATQGTQSQRSCEEGAVSHGTPLDISGELVFRPVIVAADGCRDGAEWFEDDEGNTYLTGPALPLGMLESVEIKFDELNEGWLVAASLREGRPGIDDLNDILAVCVDRGRGCESGRLVVLVGDHIVASPEVQAASIPRQSITIAADLSEEEATLIADAIE